MGELRPNAKLVHYLAALEGLALHRHWLVGDRSAVEGRVSNLRRWLSDDEPLAAFEFAAPELGAVDGYARWAASYDETPNPLILLEEPAVRKRIDARPAGRALDAACGTGRHTAYLSERGHQVVGVDLSEAMLAEAEKHGIDAEFKVGELTQLPLEDESVDLVVCALALSHCADLRPAIEELARVLAPGGRMILSDFHPLMIQIGGSALFVDGEGNPACVRSYAHLVSSYIRAFSGVGLQIVACEEPSYTEEQVPALMGPLPSDARDAVSAALVGLPGALIWELERPERSPHPRKVPRVGT